ncbi:MAG TPA: hypothetical protein EYP33_02055 [Pyrodictium sp.]|nr:hypothetical protein [Pyrodictium sp.]
MSMQISVKYDDVYYALETLRGIKLRGSIQGPPLSKLPLREIVEKGLGHAVLGLEEYRGSRIVGVKITDNLYLICHFGTEEPDDFCVVLEAENAWGRVIEAADKLSRLMKESYTLTLSAIIHALQGIISSEEGEIEEISDPDQVIEELLTWLPEYVAVTE